MSDQRDDDAARRACERLVIDSAAHNDAGDWQALGLVYADDGELVRPSGQTVSGRSAIIEAYQAGPADRLTRHACTNIAIDITGPDTATGRTVVLLFVADPQPDGEAGRSRTTVGPAVGEFADDFRLTDDGWRIARRVATIVMRPRD